MTIVVALPSPSPRGHSQEQPAASTNKADAPAIQRQSTPVLVACLGTSFGVPVSRSAIVSNRARSPPRPASVTNGYWRKPSGGSTLSSSTGPSRLLCRAVASSSFTQSDSIECFDHRTRINSAAARAASISFEKLAPAPVRRSHQRQFGDPTRLRNPEPLTPAPGGPPSRHLLGHGSGNLRHSPPGSRIGNAPKT